MELEALGNTSVVGLQWGDEGKGKIVDLATAHFDVVVRYSGGANAGHTVIIGDRRFALHLLPSGVLRPGILNVIGPGVALDLETLLTEIDTLRGEGFELAANLLISRRAHLVMPYHKKQDHLSESNASETRRIGTTTRGIGPCYADKALRTPAFRVADLDSPEAFRSRLTDVVAARNRMFAALYDDTEPLIANEIADQYLAFADRLRRHFADTTLALQEAIRAGKRILFEGAQGAMLDVDHGTYPYVTSTTCTAGGVAAGAGVSPTCVQSYLGVMKAYSTRVGAGPLPTELADETGDRIRRRGKEFGTTTGRPRRCGWFDAFAVKYAVELSGITQIALMHLDTLAGLPEVRICTGYLHDGKRLAMYPSDADTLAEVEPIYEALPGWDELPDGIESFEQLPDGARRYVERLEEYLAVPIMLISIGAERSATLHRDRRSRAPVTV